MSLGRRFVHHVEVSRATHRARSGRARRWLWSATVVVTLAALAVSIWLLVDLGAPLFSRESGLQPNASFIVLYAVVGWFVVVRAPGNRIGPLLCVMAATGSLAALGSTYVVYSANRAAGRLPFDTLAFRATGPLYVASFVALAVALPLWFPDGRVAGRWLRPVEWLGGVAVLSITVAMASVSGAELAEMAASDSTPSGGLVGTLFRVSNDLQQILPWFALGSMLLRYRTAGPTARRQIRWFTVAACLIAFDAIELVHPLPAWLDGVRQVPWIPIAIAAAILRHQLFGIDVSVRRSLLYGALVGALLAGYVGAVEIVAALLGLHGVGAGLVATAVLAVLMQPARSRLEALAERWVYGGRRDASAALRDVGEHVRASDAGDLLEALCAAVVSGARVDGAAIMLPSGERVSSGRVLMIGDRFDLVHAGRVVAELQIARRTGEHGLGRPERTVVEALLPALTIAVHATALGDEVRRSRGRLIGAREEERRRLRRDLHDGLGPALAGITMEIQAARALVPSDPERADEMLGAAEHWSRSAIGEIRRVVYGLRPPVLDELGLVPALEQHAATLGTRTLVSIRAEGPLGVLPAATEVATYLIVLEALTNVAHHADARTCTVQLAASEAGVVLEVVDDGHGLPTEPRLGVGLSSMRERAEELGGSFDIDREHPTGTRIAVRIPAIGPT
jgi:signal transduction histidine kinase